MESGAGMVKPWLPSNPIKEFQTRQNVFAMGNHVQNEPLRKQESEAGEGGVDFFQREIGEDSENSVHEEDILGRFEPLLE